jgi:glutamine amidotransferase-like uncharacterized protein
MKLRMMRFFAVAVAFFAAAASAVPPLRVGVYADVGARGSVLAFSKLAALSPDCEAKFIDGAAVRAGALSKVDVLLMSGGSSIDISASLGDEGRTALERFIREGGCYLGSCAGALLMMESEKYKGLGIVPYTRVAAPPRGGGMISTVWAECARDLAGIAPGRHSTTYHRGPVMTPCEGHPRLGDFTVMARFGGNVLTTGLYPDCPSMGGYASCVAGRYGKGKVWVFSDHPEASPHTMDLVLGGIRYLTGRSVRFVRAQKRPGQFVVGWPTSVSPGAEGAAFVVGLVKDPDFHVRGGGFSLGSADAVVVCDSPDATRLKKLASPEGVRDLKRFLGRGGHVVAWGRGAGCVAGMCKGGEGLHFVKGPAEAMETLRALKMRPLPSVPAPSFAAALPRKEGAVRTGFLLGPGSNGACLFRLLRLIAASSNHDVRFLLGSDVAAGSLSDFDLLVVPGGWSQTQMKSLGEAGRSNLVSWVRGGGAYYGTCAGAYLVGQSNAERTYIGLTPYRPQVCPYRGNSKDVQCALTDDGRKALGLSAKTFTTLYWGGPVFEPAPETALPDSDIRTFATYASQNVYSFSTNTVPAMGGRAAIVGGTLGKGKVLTVATHPEFLAGSRYVVRAGLKYLTGKSAAGAKNPHVRGGLALGFYCADFSTREVGDLAVKLMGQPGIDLEDVSSHKLDDGVLDHLDAVVLPVPTVSACRFLAQFVSRGGKVYACCRTKEQRNAVKALPADGVVVCDDEHAVVKAVQRIAN